MGAWDSKICAKVPQGPPGTWTWLRRPPLRGPSPTRHPWAGQESSQAMSLLLWGQGPGQNFTIQSPCSLSQEVRRPGMQRRW